MPQCLIGLGSNKGDRRHQLNYALELLSNRNDTRFMRSSSWHVSQPVGGPIGQGEFLNGAVLLESKLAPSTLLEWLQEIEEKCGRVRGRRWDARHMDLDLLLYGDRVISQPGLEVPHPWLAIRSFVLDPAVEIAPETVHPLLGRTISQLHQHLARSKPILAITGVPHSGKTRLAHEIAKKWQATVVTDARASFQGTSSGDALSDEIDLLERRTHRLSDSIRNRPGFLISDFWIGQSLVHAPFTFGLDRINEFEKAWDKIPASCRSPKLTLILRQGQEGLSTTAATMQQRFVIQARRWAGPYLELDSADFNHTLRDSLAAVHAMRFVDRS